MVVSGAGQGVESSLGDERIIIDSDLFKITKEPWCTRSRGNRRLL